MQVSSKFRAIHTTNGTDPKRPSIRATSQATEILVDGGDEVPTLYLTTY
ncbi:hypothetical protein SAMN05444398_10998 [Roseovarius pacificus]|uniref:Uncharacterized protein n=1 Tax=Roseovarius pacificus TaxID=337701 RepID=A0A1M7FRU8_9RHOB|nr:hypothetical protein SAMN05444398_10998 [Roseovarius pacificus]